MSMKLTRIDKKANKLDTPLYNTKEILQITTQEVMQPF